MSGNPDFLNNQGNQGYQTFLHIGFESGKPGLRTRVPWFFNQAWTRVKPWFYQALGMSGNPDFLNNQGNQGYQTFLHIGFESGKPGLRTRVPWFFNQAWTRVKPWFYQALDARGKAHMYTCAHTII